MKKYIFLAVSALSLAACTNDKLDDSLENDPVPMSFIADLSAMNSRANTDGTAFTEGDKVGIFPLEVEPAETTQNNLCYTLGTDGVFSSENPYWFRDRNSVIFNAYYPYKADLTGSEIELDTRDYCQVADPDVENWRKNDFLFASKAATVNNATVSFTGETAFCHVMSKVTFKFKAGDGVDDLADLSEYSLGSLNFDGYFNVVTGSVTYIRKSETLEMAVTGSAQTEITVDPLILIPQETRDLTLIVTYNASKYYAPLNLSSLEPGKHYMFTATIDNTGMKVSQASIVDWETETGSISATM